MQSDEVTGRTGRPRSDAYMVNDDCSCFWFWGMARAALVGIVLAGTVPFTTGYSSTGGSAKGGLIASVSKAQPDTVPEDDGGYQPPRSPSFNDSDWQLIEVRSVRGK